jgi:hypothetical protein
MSVKLELNRNPHTTDARLKYGRFLRIVLVLSFGWEEEEDEEEAAAEGRWRVAR